MCEKSNATICLLKLLWKVSHCCCFIHNFRIYIHHIPWKNWFDGKKQIENGTWLAAYSPDTVHHHLFAQKNKNLCEMVFRVMLYVIDWLIDSILKQKKIYEKPFCTTILTNFYNHIIYYIYFLHKLNSKKYHVSSNILLSDMFPIMMIIIEIVVI